MKLLEEYDERNRKENTVSSIAWNVYGEKDSEELNWGNTSHLVCELHLENTRASI